MRDVKYDRQLGRLATLTTNGAVQLWDPHLSHIRTVRAPRLSCMAKRVRMGLLMSATAQYWSSLGRAGCVGGWAIHVALNMDVHTPVAACLPQRSWNSGSPTVPRANHDILGLP